MNGAHAHVFFFQLALFHQPAADRPVGVAVLVGVAQAQLTAVFQLHPARTLDLQELQVHRIGQPGQHRCLDAVTVDDFGRVVGLEHPTLKTAAQAFALQFGVHTGQVDHDHVIRDAVNRHMVGCRGAQAARVDRLVVAGNQAVGIVLCRAQAVHLQVLLKEGTHLGGAGCGAAGRFAGGCPHRVALELFAAVAPGIKAGQQVFIADGRQVFPSGRGIGGDSVGLGLGALAAVAAGQQSQHRQCPGQVAQGRFHVCIPVMSEHEGSPLSFMWLLVFGPGAAILAAHLRRPK